MLKVEAVDADAVAVLSVPDVEASVLGDGHALLRDLVAGREVCVEVMLCANKGVGPRTVVRVR